MYFTLRVVVKRGYLTTRETSKQIKENNPSKTLNTRLHKSRLRERHSTIIDTYLYDLLLTSNNISFK